MGLLDSALDKAKRFNENLKERQTSKLVDDTEAMESRFAEEAGKIGIDVDSLKDGVIGVDATNSIYDTLMDAYNTARNKDFEEYDSRTSVPLDEDSLKEATDAVIRWNKRYKETVNKTFGRFWDYGAELKRLETTNKNLTDRETEESKRIQLKENMAKIEAMVRIFDTSDRIIRAVIERAEYNLTIIENNLADDLKKSIS